MLIEEPFTINYGRLQAAMRCGIVKVFAFCVHFYAFDEQFNIYGSIDCNFVKKPKIRSMTEIF